MFFKIRKMKKFVFTAAVAFAALAGFNACSSKGESTAQANDSVTVPTLADDGVITEEIIAVVYTPEQARGVMDQVADHAQRLMAKGDTIGAVNYLNDASAKLQQLQQRYPQLVNYVNQKAQVVNAVSPTTGNVQEVIENDVNKGKDAVKDAGNDIKEAAAKGADNVKDATKEGVQNLKDGAKDAANAIGVK